MFVQAGTVRTSQRMLNKYQQKAVRGVASRPVSTDANVESIRLQHPIDVSDGLFKGIYTATVV